MKRVAVDWAARTGMWAALTMYVWEKHPGFANWRDWGLFAFIALVCLASDVWSGIKGRYDATCGCKMCDDPQHLYEVRTGKRRGI